MIHLLSLDLGVTTGFCIQDRLEVYTIGILEYESEKQFESCLTAIILEYLPNKYLAEMPVIIRGPLGTQLEGVVAATRRVIRQSLETCQPSEWKQSHSKEPIPKHLALRKLTTHERDAYRMGRWWLKTHAE